MKKFINKVKNTFKCMLTLDTLREDIHRVALDNEVIKRHLDQVSAELNTSTKSLQSCMGCCKELAEFIDKHKELLRATDPANFSKIKSILDTLRN